MKEVSIAEGRRRSAPETATARLLVRALAKGAPPLAVAPGERPAPLVRWLQAQRLGPLAYARFGDQWPLADELRRGFLTTAAKSILWQTHVMRIGREFSEIGLPLVLLKGAALAESAYGDAALRPMSDVDIWVYPGSMEAATQIMTRLNFRHQLGKDSRPPAMQRLSGGEMKYLGPHEELVELHWSPFPGWWIQRTTCVAEEAIWSRIEKLPRETAGISGGDQPTDANRAPDVYQLAPEDMVIQLAAHIAVNHQFGKHPLQGLIDIALTAEARPVDWEVVARRARTWRLATVVWAVLHLLDQIVDMGELRPALERLQPTLWRRLALRQLVSEESVLTGADRRRSATRFLLLLLLVDRPADMLRLMWRTVWPEREWLAARYNDEVGPGRHLWRLLRQRQI